MSLGLKVRGNSKIFSCQRTRVEGNPPKGYTCSCGNCLRADSSQSCSGGLRSGLCAGPLSSPAQTYEIILLWTLLLAQELNSLERCPHNVVNIVYYQ